MTKQHRALIFVTFIVSCVALALLLLSISTSSWVQSTPRSTYPGFRDTQVNYGLFTGLYSRPISGSEEYGLTMICLYEHNICGLSCKKTAAERKKEFQSLYNDEKPKFSCTEYSGRSVRSISNESTTALEEPSKNNDLTFINCGVHLSTIIFLGIAMLLSLTSGVITVLNITGNPVNSLLNILGLYIWNGLASVSILIVLLLWGIHFGVTMSHNIAIRDTIVKEWTSDGLSSMGYSYWILLLPMLLHIVNIGILFYRQYAINKEVPTMVAANSEVTDGAIFLY